MIGTVRKHQTWLWVIIIAAVVVSFVIYFTPGVTLDRSHAWQTQYGLMHGRPITRKAMSEAVREVQIRLFLRTGNWPDASEARRLGVDLDRQARERLVLLDRMEKLGIQVPDAAVARWIEENLGNPTQPGSARALYQEVVQRLSQQGVPEVDLARYIRHEIGIRHLLDLTSVAGGLVTPREAAAEYRRRNERLQVEVALFSLSNHLAAVTVEPAELAAFYTNRLAFYRIPERVQVQYVRFEVTNYLARAEEALARRTNLTAEIDALYLQAGPNRFVDTNGQVLAPDAAKARIREQMREEQARLAARREAANFARELEKMQPVRPENLATLAAQKGLPVTTIAPFSEAEGPAGLTVRANFARAAFALSAEQPFSPPVVAEDAVYVLAFQRRFPSEVPPLEAVLERVTEEFKRDRALALARQAGTNFLQTLEAELARGRSFTEITTAAGATWVSLPQFSAATETLPHWDPRVRMEQIKLVVQDLKLNVPSRLVHTVDGAMVVLLRAREPVSESELQEALPAFLAELRASRRFEGFNDWLQRQIALTGITMSSPEVETP